MDVLKRVVVGLAVVTALGLAFSWVIGALAATEQRATWTAWAVVGFVTSVFFAALAYAVGDVVVSIWQNRKQR